MNHTTLAESERINRLLCILLAGSVLFLLAAITAAIFKAKPVYPEYNDPITLNTSGPYDTAIPLFS